MRIVVLFSFIHSLFTFGNFEKNGKQGGEGGKEGGRKKGNLVEGNEREKERFTTLSFSRAHTTTRTYT